MSEILQQNYKEPTQTVAFGLESGESGSNRNGFDDVDDYHNLSDSAPKKRDGTAITGYTGWTRTVTVEWLAPANFATVSVTDQNVKRVTVTVKKGTQAMSSVVAIKINGWSDFQYNGVTTTSN